MDELEAFGLTYDDVRDQFEPQVWPENEPAFVAFGAMGSQWRVGPAGPYGLDYTPLRDVLRDYLRIPRAQWPEIFDGVRVCEIAALDVMHKDKDKKR